MFMTLKSARSRRFPLEHSEVLKSDFLEKVPWSAFRIWLLELGGRENFGEDSIWVDYENHGSINFRGSSSSVYLDTHASWNDVLDAYLMLRSLNEDATIFDCQDGRFHDESSFRVLMKEQSG